jgi:hypothetical protein
MLGTFFLGDDETTNDTAPTAPSVDAKGVDPVKLDSLGKLVGVKKKTSGQPLDPGSETHWVIPISAPLVAALAKLDATKRKTIAKSWAATPEWQSDGGTPTTLDKLLAATVKLAVSAVDDDKTMFLWISL